MWNPQDAAAFLGRYSYELPPELIAHEPASPRDSSKLLVVGAGQGGVATGELRHSSFANLADFLPKGAVLVMNETRVVPARVILTKETGGRAEILFYVNDWDRTATRIKGISDRKLTVGQRLGLEQGKPFVTVTGQDENVFEFELAVAPTDFLVALEARGVMPIPKYIKTPLSEGELKDRYQTTFAKDPGSVAAPTASLHFTDALFERLAAKGVEVRFLTLHVGAGTFAPVTARELALGKLHTERFSISQETLGAVAMAKREGRPVIAVGTTALRALESAAAGASGTTDIFIRPPHEFKMADGLITNFHVPESSLMCLVDAFLQWKKCPKTVLEIYKEAVARKYRFFSFGDGMLIL